MEERIERLNKYIHDIHISMSYHEEKLLEYEDKLAIFVDERDGYLSVIQQQKEIAQRRKEKEKEEKMKETCGRDLADSQPQGNE